ncbi:type II secretion system F family protein [Novosphingobium sp. ZN18A2]|uniref:type II secretion system F family protein n=1 Tax=Novosphingobium sp. ZN18A2 TaxID=3079861 RepID=UPI0030D0D8F8
MIDLLIRIVVLLAIFASIFVVSQIALSGIWRSRARSAAINKRLRMIKEGASREEIAVHLRKNAPDEFPNLPVPVAKMLRAFQRSLFAAAVPLTMSQALAAIGAFFLVVFVVMALAAALWGFALHAGVVVMIGAVAAAIAIAMPLFILNNRARRRRKKVEEQFPVALDVFVRALRSGHPVASAIELLTTEMEDPIGSEFGLVSDEVAYGAELTDAIEAMAERWDLEDMRMFVVSLSVQIETGGNLAEVIENLNQVIRERASLYRKVRALSSEGRMTGWMLTVLPVVTFIGMFMVNPGFYLNVAMDPIFLFGFPSLIILYFIGVFWIRKLVDIKV